MEELVKYAEPFSKENLLALKRRLADKKEPDTTRRGLLETELAARKKEMDNLIGALAAHGTQDAFWAQVKDKIKALADKCGQLDNEIERADACGSCVSPVEAALEIFADFNNVPAASAVDKRELLKATVDRIKWDGGEAHVYLTDVTFVKDSK
jgi:hypothetical protein